MTILEIDGVYKTYGSLHALQDINLTVEEGQWVSVMGPSGSGKSTLLNIIGLMDKPTRGAMLIKGVNTSTLNTRKLTEIRRDKIGLVFQQFHLIPHLSALENVMVAQYYHSMPDRDEALEALKRVGLGDRAHHLPGQLSGGEQQRVCVARALINYPALILADEPTANLDEKNEEIIIELFQQLHREGHTIVMATHNPGIGQLAQRQITIHHGRTRASGDGSFLPGN